MTFGDGDTNKTSISLGRQLAVIPIGIGLFAMQLFLERFPYGRVAEWLFATSLGVAAAAVFFREKRSQRWFWWSIAAIVASQTILIVVQGPAGAGLPVHLGKGFMAIVGADTALTSFLLYWLSWVFDPHKAQRTEASKQAAVVIYMLVALFVAIMAFIYWALKRG